MKKFERLYKLFPPQERLDILELPNGKTPIRSTRQLKQVLLSSTDNDFDPMGDGPYLRSFGWAFTEEFAFDYARRHNLEEDLSYDDELVDLAGRSVFKFAELSDNPPEKQIEKLWANLRMIACDLMLDHIQKEMGFSLEIAYPFSGEFMFMLVLYNNYNIAKRYWIIERLSGTSVPETAGKLNKIMTAPGEEERKPLWWYDRENPIVRV